MAMTCTIMGHHGEYQTSIAHWYDALRKLHNGGERPQPEAHHRRLFADMVGCDYTKTGVVYPDNWEVPTSGWGLHLRQYMMIHVPRAQVPIVAPSSPTPVLEADDPDLASEAAAEAEAGGADTFSLVSDDSPKPTKKKVKVKEELDSDGEVAKKATAPRKPVHSSPLKVKITGSVAAVLHPKPPQNKGGPREKNVEIEAKATTAKSEGSTTSVDAKPKHPRCPPPSHLLTAPPMPRCPPPPPPPPRKQESKKRKHPESEAEDDDSASDLS